MTDVTDVCPHCENGFGLTHTLYKEYRRLYSQTDQFISSSFGDYIAFEHGVVGQTVAHTHLIPFSGNIEAVVPETNQLNKITSLDFVRTEYKAVGKYLFVEVGGQMWAVVNTSIGPPQIFSRSYSGIARSERTCGLENCPGQLFFIG